MNQRGGIPAIIIICCVILVLGIFATIFMLNSKRPPIPTSSPSADCTEKDYTGCDTEKEFATWDGKVD